MKPFLEQLLQEGARKLLQAAIGFSLAIGCGHQHKEPQKTAATSTLPEQLAYFHVANPVVFAAMKDFSLFPGNGLNGSVPRQPHRKGHQHHRSWKE